MKNNHIFHFWALYSIIIYLQIRFLSKEACSWADPFQEGFLHTSVDHVLIEVFFYIVFFNCFLHWFALSCENHDQQVFESKTVLPILFQTFDKIISKQDILFRGRDQMRFENACRFTVPGHINKLTSCQMFRASSSEESSRKAIVSQYCRLRNVSALSSHSSLTTSNVQDHSVNQIRRPVQLKNNYF